jgi:hypothetical protein
LRIYSMGVSSAYLNFALFLYSQVARALWLKTADNVSESFPLEVK